MNYKAPDNSLHFLSEQDIASGGESYLPKGSVAISEAEAESLTKKPTYKDMRASEYPPFQDYLDAIVKGDEGQKRAYIDACLSVKKKYPKDATK